ncbi:GRIP and coiled-coil domain-containing protein 2 [Actinomortierella wolfii]|nr:GRIP and coiled-coil domain-containing protein 2 [Actinomortierella wolfii]
MFNTLLKKASEVETQIGNSIAALAGEPGNSRPTSPNTVRRPMATSPLGHNPNSGARKLASQLDEAYHDIESFQKLLQKATQEKKEMSKDVDRLEDENKALREELEQAEAVIKAMRGSLENKATAEFLTDRVDGQGNGCAPAIDSNDEQQSKGVMASNLDDPLGATGSPKVDTPTLGVDSPVTQHSTPLDENNKVEKGGQASHESELSAQIADLTRQLNSLKEECQQIDEAMAKQKTEHEEKMKKMKAIFAAANKSINEYRQQIAAKDEEIEALKSRTESAETQPKPDTEDQSQVIEELQAKLDSQAETYSAKLDQMENKLKTANSQLDRLKEEYTQYKQRASSLLQQQRATAKTDGQGDSSQLKAQIDLLEKQIRTLSEDLQESENKRVALDNEYQLALDQVASLETSRDMVRRLERQNARLQKDLEKAIEDAQRDRDAAEARIASLQELHMVETQSLRNELSGAASHVEDRLSRKEEELTELHRILERSEADLATARSEIQKLNEALQAKTAVATDSAKSGNGHLQISTTGLNGSPFLEPKSASSQQEQDSPVSRTSSSMSMPSERPPVYASLSDLLAARPLVDRSPFLDNNGTLGTKGASTLTSAKEREYQLKLQQLTELLNESEANNQRLLDQEKVLKEEIRNLDRSEKRQNLSVDYLKNIVLKFLVTSDREPLIPVLSTVLQLSPEEVATLKKKAVNPSTPSLVPSLSRSHGMDSHDEPWLPTHVLLWAMAEEYIEEARAMAFVATAQPKTFTLWRARHQELVYMAIKTLTAVQALNTPEFTQLDRAKTGLRLAQILFEETENHDRAEREVAQAIILADSVQGSQALEVHLRLYELQIMIYMEKKQFRLAKNTLRLASIEAEK